MTNGPSLEIEWYNQRGQRIQNNRRFEIKTATTSERPLTKVSTLSVSNFDPSADTGSYECRARVNRQRESANFEIKSDDGKKPPFYLSTRAETSRTHLI